MEDNIFQSLETKHKMLLLNTTNAWQAVYISCYNVLASKGILKVLLRKITLFYRAA